MPFRPGRRAAPSLLLALAVLSGIALSACGSGASSANGSSSTTSTTGVGTNGVESLSPSEIVSAAVAATEQQSAVRTEEVTAQSGATIQLVNNVGAKGADQTIVISQGSIVGHVEIRYVDGVAYFRGDKVGLDNFTKFGETTSAKYAGKWISVTSKQQGFSSLTGAVTVADVANQYVKLPGTLSRGTTTALSGQTVMGVNSVVPSSTSKLTLTMYVQTKGSKLPVEVRGITTAKSGGSNVTVSFSHWGEPVTVIKPSGAVSIAVVEPSAG